MSLRSKASRPLHVAVLCEAFKCFLSHLQHAPSCFHVTIEVTSEDSCSVVAKVLFFEMPMVSSFGVVVVDSSLLICC